MKKPRKKYRKHPERHGLNHPVARAVEKQSTKRAPDGSRVFRHRKDHIYKSMCVFFDQDERRCTVYKARPHVCRQYPNGNKCGYYDFIRFERSHQDDEEFIPSA